MTYSAEDYHMLLSSISDRKRSPFTLGPYTLTPSPYQADAVELSFDEILERVAYLHAGSTAIN